MSCLRRKGRQEDRNKLGKENNVKKKMSWEEKKNEKHKGKIEKDRKYEKKKTVKKISKEKRMYEKTTFFRLHAIKSGSTIFNISKKLFNFI